MKSLAFIIFALLSAPLMAAEPGIPALTMTTAENGAQEYTVTLQILFLMSALTILPSLIIMLTSFTRITIVLGILRRAIGLQQTPSNQVLMGLALFLTFFTMAPVFNKINESAVQPQPRHCDGGDVGLCRCLRHISTTWPVCAESVGPPTSRGNQPW